MFELESFIADCKKAVRASDAQSTLREVVARAVSDPARIMKALSEPKRAEMQTLYRAPDLTVLNVIWAPNMNLLPHNHQMWAVIGIYTGREDNIFWRRREDRVEASGAKALCQADTILLGRDIIHSVINPIPRLTGAIHVYGGDFFGVPRSEWDPETLVEQDCDGNKMRRRFEDANSLLALTENIRV